MGLIEWQIVIVMILAFIVFVVVLIILCVWMGEKGNDEFNTMMNMMIERFVESDEI